jgi:predicted ATPase
VITRVKVNGFKSLADFDMSLKPGLNILVGPNGSGKTNIVSFFEFLSCIITSNAAEATSRLKGAGAVFRRIASTYEGKIAAQVWGCYPQKAPRSKSEAALFVSYEYSFDLFFSQDSVGFLQQQLKQRFSSTFVDANQIHTVESDWELNVQAVYGEKTDVHLKRLTRAALDIFPWWDIKSDTLNAQFEGIFKTLIATTASIPGSLSRLSPIFEALVEDISGGQAYNIIPSHVRLSEDSARPPGIASDGSGLAATLYALMKPDPPFSGIFPNKPNSLFRRLDFDRLMQYLRLANPTIEGIEVSNDSFNNQLRISFKVKSGEYSANIPLALMSDGTLKWITLLTAALTVSSVFSIEEPENFLHPRIQSRLIDVMRDILFGNESNTATLMTTHSETVLNSCKPSEIIITSFKEGRTVATRCSNQSEVSDEIARTGFGLGYFYAAGALEDNG